MNTVIKTFMLLAAGASLMGCRAKSRKSTYEYDVLARNEYMEYLSADPGEAREILVRAIKRLESEDGMAPSGQARLLYIDFARLYVLQKRLGNDNLGEAALVKARYWFLRSQELDGVTDVKAAKAVALLRAEECKSAVVTQDDKVTHGEGPKYLKRLERASNPATTNP